MRHWLNSWWFKTILTILLIGLLLAWVGPERIWISLRASNPWLLQRTTASITARVGGCQYWIRGWEVIITACIRLLSSSTISAKAVKSRLRIASRQIFNRRGASLTRFGWSGLV